MAQEVEKLREEERRLNLQRQLALANNDQLTLQDQEHKEERRLKKQQRSLSNIPTSLFGVDNKEDQFFGLRNRKKNTVLPVVLNSNGKREINSPSDWLPGQDDHTHFVWSKDNNGITEIPYQKEEDSGMVDIVSNALGTAYKFIKNPSWSGEAKAPTSNLNALNYMVEDDDEDM